MKCNFNVLAIWDQLSDVLVCKLKDFDWHYFSLNVLLKWDSVLSKKYKNQSVNNHFGASSNLTSPGSNLTWDKIIICVSRAKKPKINENPALNK